MFVCMDNVLQILCVHYYVSLCFSVCLYVCLSVCLCKIKRKIYQAGWSRLVYTSTVQVSHLRNSIFSGDHDGRGRCSLIRGRSAGVDKTSMREWITRQDYMGHGAAVGLPKVRPNRFYSSLAMEE